MTVSESRRDTLRWWERSLERIASTRPGGWFYVSIATWLDRRLLRVSRGRISCALTWPSLLLTTTGARTGRMHTVPLLYLADGDRLILVASTGTKHQAKDPHYGAYEGCITAHRREGAEEKPNRYRIVLEREIPVTLPV